jgi:putative ABC transport system ATP-binding protein
VTPDYSHTHAADGTAVRAADVTKTYGTGDSRTVALKNTSFSTREGELHLVVGPSGCGKTTLLSVVAGTLEWDQGQIEVFGITLNGLSPKEITTFRRQNIGFIFQQFNLIPTLTTVENVSVPLLLAGVKRSEAEARAADMLKEVGLAEKLRKRPGDLSGGQQQRVAIARALVNEPALLLADEPTGNLDSRTSIDIMSIFQRLNDNGMTIVVVTHEPDIAQYAKRIVVMRDGQIILDQPVRKRRNAAVELAAAPQTTQLEEAFQ